VPVRAVEKPGPARLSKRILHIIPSLDRAGAEKQLVLLAGRLAPSEFDVHVVALTRGGPLAAELDRQGIPLTVIGKRWKFDPMAYARLERRIRELRPDLVHSWLFAANAYGRAAAAAAGVKHLVATERSVDPWKAWHQFAIDRYLVQKTHSIVVNSAGVRDFYVRHGLPGEKFTIIPNGVLPAESSDMSRAQLLAELGLPGDSRLIGTVGRLWPQKRIKDSIWALDLIRVLRTDMHLLVIGDGPQRRHLERFARLVTCDAHVHFLGLRHDVPRLMPHFDFLWQASGYEGLPNAVMEAMAAGVPVVATDISGNRDLVVPGETGFLVSVGDRAGLARYGNKLLCDAELRARLGNAGRQRIVAHFGVEQMVDRHVALYRKILG
jgi:glycosyltransferase involved in cell wall biosynthesis